MNVNNKKEKYRKKIILNIAPWHAPCQPNQSSTNFPVPPIV